MVPQSRSGTFSPNPTVQTAHSAITHSPHPSQAGALSAGASPSTSSPTGTNSLTKIVVAQVYLLLSTIKEDKDDPGKWELHTDQLRRLIHDNGMEVFSKYFSRLVAGNAPQIFPGLNRPVANPGNYHLLVGEMRKLSRDISQARKIAESIETGSEEIFRDFDLSTFMEHFKLDALEKTVLALAFKLGSRSDLRTKADAILSTNFPTFVNILRRADGDHDDLAPNFIAEIVDRFIQLHPPNFNAAAKSELRHNVQARYALSDQAPPSEVLAALDLMRVLGDKPPNALALYIHRHGSEFTNDEDTCTSYLRNRPATIQLSEEQVAVALTYTTISRTPPHQPPVLVDGLRHVLPDTFRWQYVVSYLDQRDARISSAQFLSLYNALLPIAQADSSAFDIERLWGGEWDNPETQLSFICAFASLPPTQLDASTIPGLVPTFTLDTYAQSAPPVRDQAVYAVKHPLVSVAALSAVFNVALHSHHASQSIEAKRLFQEVVVPNLDIFVVSAFGVPKPWPAMAVDTLISLFENFFYKRSPEYDFVLDSLWRRDKDWVTQRLIDAHAVKPTDLGLIFEHALKHKWIDELVYLPNGFGLDLAALAHAEGYLDLQQWARRNSDRSNDMARSLLQFLNIKAEVEMAYQRSSDGQAPVKASTTLQVQTVYNLLQILEEFLPKNPVPELIIVQRKCITAYPRLINYGEGYDDVIDTNGKDGNALPPAANVKMEEHYKRMYGDDIQVRNIVEILERYKRSRDPLEQDVFACMIHGLFDEYAHYVDYPLEALATTAVLFGGIISHKLISDLPLQIGLGMILEAVRDHTPDEPMYKFGLQALMQLLTRLHEWPGFCKQLIQIPGLRGTEAFKKAEDAIREHEDELAHSRNGNGGPAVGHSSIPGAGDHLTNGSLEEAAGGPEPQAPPFASINVDPAPPGVVFEDPGEDAQGKIQFVLNNLTETTLQSMFRELRELMEIRHQQWFSSHLVEERARMQPNYHHVYLDLVKQFEDKTLWAEVLRQTYAGVQRMLNSDATIQNTTERTHLKNLGGWLGLLTLARDMPIKQKNIAFKQLLIEAHDTKRLIVVIPFVCKVLIQGASSNVFRPPNPWLMDIIHLLIELYHNAELKLNLKFEIEVLCKGLSLDHKSIEPSGEILNRIPAEDAVAAVAAAAGVTATADIVGQDALEGFENLSLNGMGPGVTTGLSPHTIVPSIPDLSASLQIPSTEVVAAARLHEMVRVAFTRALQDIIQPVVDRSVTIAAISTQQMIHKDFATEPDENRVRTSAVNMVKSTAGSLALVTSKEPLRANFTNHMRNLASELPQGLPEGIILMCVNSNLELASGVIEKSAEDRAVPEIEEMIEAELDARRRHRMQRPTEPYVDPGLSRWAWTIPNPFKLSPNIGGLNPEQMAIYEDFARQPRSTATAATPSHVPSTSDTTRSLANEVLQDQYNSVPSIPTPAETPALPHLGTQQAAQQHYPQLQSGVANGRQAAAAAAAAAAGLNQLDARSLADRVSKLLHELQRVAAESREDHFATLPRPHPILDIVDALVQLIIKTHQTSEEFVSYAAEQISHILLTQVDNTLLLETLVHVLEALRKIAGTATSQAIRLLFHQQPGDAFLHLPLIAALLTTDLLDWSNIDTAIAKALQQRKAGSIEFLEQLMDLALLNDSPLALYADFVRSLEEAWSWVSEDPEVAGGQRLKAKILAPPPTLPASMSPEERRSIQREQMDYVFDEWVHLANNPNASEKSAVIFIQQMHSGGVVTSKDDFFVFTRQAIEKSIDRFEHTMQSGATALEGYRAIDALAKMVSIFLKSHETTASRASFLDSVFALATLVLNHNIERRGGSYHQRVFFRFFCIVLHEVNTISEGPPESEHYEILLRAAARFHDLGPVNFPSFTYAWISLIQHRMFMPILLSVPNGAGWGLYTAILKQLLEHLGEQMKSIEVLPASRDLYRAVLKHLIILQHDFPEYVSANHMRLSESLPPHCTQLLNVVLVATPESASKMPDPLQPGLKVDRMSEMRDAPASCDDPAGYLRRVGLLDILDHTLQTGPSEDAIAQITYSISRPDEERTTFGHVPVRANQKVIDAVIAYIGGFAVTRLAVRSDGSQAYVPGSADAKTLFMLVTELSPEPRYYLLGSIINQLRFANAYTHYFSQALLDIFGYDLADPEQAEIRQQIVRILLERLVGFWPQPWGLMVTIIELAKNDKYMFFELPFIKSAPEVGERFAAILHT